MRPSWLAMAALLAASMAVAQTKTSPTQAPATNPSSPPPSGAANPSAAQSQPAGGGHRMLQAKSQEELKAYNDDIGITDPAQALAAADAFAAKFPNSELRAALYIRAMNLYGQQNNADKSIEAGRKAIAADPTNPVPLVQVASALAESTRETDMDRQQRLAEAAKDAQGAIDNVDTGLIVPPNAPADKVAAAKRSIVTMAYDTLGLVNMSKKDYAAAEQDLLKAADASKGAPDAVVYLRLSVAQDQQKKYPEALESANKAVQYAPDGSQAQNLAKQQQVRLQKLIAAGSSGGGGVGLPSEIPAPAGPGSQPSQPTQQTQPKTPPR